MHRPHRNKGPKGADFARFVRLEHHMLASPAWRSLSPYAVSAYVLLASRFNGANNGDISLSIREIVDSCGMSQGAASNALCELRDKGLVRLRSKGSFTTKAQRLASTYALTCWGVDKADPSKEYMRWSPPASRPKPSPRGRKPPLRLVVVS